MKDVQKFRHTTSAKERLEIARKQVREILLAENDVIETYKRMADKKVNNNAIKMIVADLFDFKPERFMNVTVVFNEKKTTDVVLYYDSGATIRYNTYGGTEKVTTKGGEKTQTVKALDSADGKEVLLQLFESTGTLRIIIANGWFIEFYK